MYIKYNLFSPSFRNCKSGSNWKSKHVQCSWVYSLYFYSFKPHKKRDTVTLSEAFPCHSVIHLHSYSLKMHWMALTEYIGI